MSAWTGARLADLRRDLVDQDLRAGDPRRRAHAYLLAMAQSPGPVRWWSWWLSAWDGAWPSRTREALAAAADTPAPRTGHADVFVHDAGCPGGHCGCG